MQCWECGGVGHLQYECVNTKKKKSKLSTSISDDKATEQSDEEADEGVIVNHVVFMPTIEWTIVLDYPSHIKDQVITLVAIPKETRKTKKYVPICH